MELLNAQFMSEQSKNLSANIQRNKLEEDKKELENKEDLLRKKMQAEGD